MKQKKIKRYRLSVSRTFPTTHPRKGEPTYFMDKIMNAIVDTEGYRIHTPDGIIDIWPKLHTIRGNYERWEKIMIEVQSGNAVIELFYWDGKPYGKGVKQVVFATLDKDSGCGVQELKFGQLKGSLIPVIEGMASRTTCIELSKNDSLSLEDFKAWFKCADLSKPLAIIHFTPFRY